MSEQPLTSLRHSQNASELANASAGLQPVNRITGAKALGEAPLVFERNTGQTDPKVKFLSRGPGYNFFLTSSEGVLSFYGQSAVNDRSVAGTKFPEPSKLKLPKATSLCMSLVDANPRAEIVGLDELPAKTNYLIGNRKNWRTKVPTYAKVKYKSVYPGIDLVYHGNRQQLEYDFVVASGADPSQIRLAFDGAKRLTVDQATGDLIIITASDSEVRQMRPKVYQQAGDRRSEVQGAYRITGQGRAAFTLADYDPRKPLIIDPTVAFTRFLAGSSEDVVAGIAVDNAGNSYVTGWTLSSDFPLQNYGPPGEITKNCYSDPTTKTNCAPEAFVTKLDPNGNILFSTYIGGSGLDLPHGIAVASGEIYVAGYTSSTDFGDGYQRNFQYAFGEGNAFVAAITPLGESYTYVTGFGGVGTNDAYAIALDSSQAAYVTGITYSVDFPTSKYFSQTLNPWQKAFGGYRDAFVVKVDPYGLFQTGYSTYIGGSGYDAGQGIAVDSQGYAYVTGVTQSTDFPTAGAASTGYPGNGGTTAFVTKLVPDGSKAVYSVYLGGTFDVSHPPAFDEGFGIALDASGDAYVTGSTCSSNFPVTAGALQTTQPVPCSSENPSDPLSAFVTELSSVGKILSSTYLGGNGNTDGNCIAVTGAGRVYIAGDTAGTSFLGKPLSFTPNPNAGFVTRLAPDLSSELFTTYLGAQINSVALLQPDFRGIPSLLLPIEVFTAGLRYRPGSNVSFATNVDGFVVKLNDSPFIFLP